MIVVAAILPGDDPQEHRQGQPGSLASCPPVTPDLHDHQPERHPAHPGLFLVTRNVVKLMLERRRGVLGTRIRTKLVVAFVT
jgi:hypothetical protein